MAVEIINDKALWDRFIEESPYGMLFHRWDFLKIVEKHTGYDLHMYGIYDGEELIGVFPIFYKKTKGVKLIYSPPQGTLAYVPYMGLVMGPAYDCFDQRKKESCIATVWGDIGRSLKKLSPNFTSMTLVRQMNDIRPYEWDGYDVEILYTYLTDLQRPLEAIWESLDKDCKNNIRKAEKLGVYIRQTTDVDTFFNNMSECLKGQGNTFFQRQSPAYLKELLAAFPDNLVMTFACLDDRVLGLKIDCLYKELFMGWCGGARMDHEINANEFFEWETIKTAKASGYKFYENWGGDMRRLNLFKSKFNPTLVPYYSVRKMDAVGKLSDWGYGMISNKPYLSFVRGMIT